MGAVWLPQLQALHSQMQTKAGSSASASFSRKSLSYVSLLLLMREKLSQESPTELGHRVLLSVGDAGTVSVPPAVAVGENGWEWLPCSQSGASATPPFPTAPREHPDGRVT